MRLRQRLDALEARKSGAFVPWVRIIQNEGQTEAQATEAYEGEHGPIGESNSILRVIIRKPGDLCLD